VITYSDLLDVFWQGHSPFTKAYSRQYMSIIFYHDEEQKRLAEESRDRYESEREMTVYTEIVPAETFYTAEDYHQKYYLQNISGLTQEYRDIYPDFEDFVNSTAVARLNGYAGGYGSQETLESQLDSLGLSPEGRERLLKMAEFGLVSACPVPST